MKLSFYSILFLCVLVGCGPITSESDIHQLTQKQFKCVDFTAAEESAALADMPANFIRKDGFSADEMERLHNGLTSLPRSHLDYFYAAHDANGFAVSERDIVYQGKTGYIGLTGYNPEWPTYLYISPKENSANNCFVHELGHAFDVKVRLDNRSSDFNFAREIDDLYEGEGKTAAANTSDGLEPMREYATNTVKEFFAESYQNFYCGPEAHNYLKAKLPSTYELLSKVLEAPKWLSTSLGGQEIKIALEQINTQYFIKLALPANSYTLRVCSTKDAAACRNENSIAMISETSTNANWKIYRTKDPVMLVNGVTFPLTIQGWKEGNSSANHDNQRIVELYQ